MALYAYSSGFPSCCACSIFTGLNDNNGGVRIREDIGHDHLYLDILTEDQKKKHGDELERMGWECIKIFKGSHGKYNLYLYASPAPDKDGKINNPGKQPSITKAISKTPIRDAFGRFVKQRFTEKL